MTKIILHHSQWSFLFAKFIVFPQIISENLIPKSFFFKLINISAILSSPFIPIITPNQKALFESMIFAPTFSASSCGGKSVGSRKCVGKILVKKTIICAAKCNLSVESMFCVRSWAGLEHQTAPIGRRIANEWKSTRKHYHTKCLQIYWRVANTLLQSMKSTHTRKKNIT